MRTISSIVPALAVTLAIGSSWLACAGPPRSTATPTTMSAPDGVDPEGSTPTEESAEPDESAGSDGTDSSDTVEPDNNDLSRDDAVEDDGSYVGDGDDDDDDIDIDGD